MSRWLLAIVSKDGESSTSVGNLYHWSVTLTVKQCFLIFRQYIYGASEMGSPDGKAHVFVLGLFVYECRQRNCLVLIVANERNVTAHNFGAYSSSFNTKRTMP